MSRLPQHHLHQRHLPFPFKRSIHRRLQRDLEVVSEALSIWIKLWFAHTPAIPEEAKATARSESAKRYDQFVDHVATTPELQCEARNKLQVLVQPPVYTWQRAVMDAMRYRPDRILVGEVRDGSALELLKAWNTGHPGGMATIHANDTSAMLDRICQLIEEIVYPAPRLLVAQTVNVCVHIRRDKTHPAGRSLSGIDRVIGIDVNGRWELEPVRQ